MPRDDAMAGLVARYRLLGAADRRAVLAHMNDDERDALERLCRAHDRTALPATGGPFAGYSPWLAACIEQAAAEPAGVAGELAGAAPTTAAGRAAMAAAHKATMAGARAESPLARLLRQLGLVAGDDPDGNGAPC